MPAHAGDDKGLYQTYYYISCSTYVQDRKEPINTGKNAVDKIYVSGWLSGYNYLTPNTYSIIPNGDMDMVMVWLDRYCAKYPTKNIEAGLLQLSDEQYPTRLESVPKKAEELKAKPVAKEAPVSEGSAPEEFRFHIEEKK